MPTDSGDRKQAKPHNNSGQSASGAPPPEQQEQLPCPRCDSTNTKFCYYNNYNFSQPRHFCKSCRRYWTHGGTLRHIPVGGGSRKNAKRSRTTSVCSNPVGSPAMPSLGAVQECSVTSRGSAQSGIGGEVLKPGLGVCSSFTSLLNTQGPGFLALSGFGLGLGPGSGLDEMAAFGLGRGVWAFPAGIGEGSAGGGAAGALGMGNTWQLEGGEGGFGGGDCFSWPDLAITTPGNGLK